MTSPSDEQSKLRQPVVVYTAATNLDAHMLVKMLVANDVAAHAIEDQSGVSLWALGTITQFHQPQIWVEESAKQRAAELIHDFEEKNQNRENSATSTEKLIAVCEDCGHTTVFPIALNGTTQDCDNCGGYLDVGEVAIENFGVPEE